MFRRRVVSGLQYSAVRTYKSETEEGKDAFRTISAEFV